MANSEVAERTRDKAGDSLPSAADPVSRLGDDVLPALFMGAVYRLVGEVLHLDQTRVQAREAEDRDGEVNPPLGRYRHVTLVILALVFRLGGGGPPLGGPVLSGDEGGCLSGL